MPEGNYLLILANVFTLTLHQRRAFLNVTKGVIAVYGKSVYYANDKASYFNMCNAEFDDQSAHARHRAVMLVGGLNIIRRVS